MCQSLLHFYSCSYSFAGFSALFLYCRFGVLIYREEKGSGTIAIGKMGVLLVPDGTAAIQPRMNLNAAKAAGAQRAIDVGNETNNNVNGLRDANSLMPTQVVGIIDVVVDDQPVRSWMPPPPKKKWIRHYLLGELIFPLSLTLSLSYLSVCSVLEEKRKEGIRICKRSPGKLCRV